MMSNLKIFSGGANPFLAQEICDYLEIALGKVKLQRFSDGEVNFQILENSFNKKAVVVKLLATSSLLLF